MSNTVIHVTIGQPEHPLDISELHGPLEVGVTIPTECNGEELTGALAGVMLQMGYHPQTVAQCFLEYGEEWLPKDESWDDMAGVDEAVRLAEEVLAEDEPMTYLELETAIREIQAKGDGEQPSWLNLDYKPDLGWWYSAKKDW